MKSLWFHIQAITHWLFPLPYIWISTAIYGGVLCTYMVYHLLYSYSPVDAPLIVSIMLALLLFDRYEVHRFGEVPPKHIALLFLIYRLLLVELVGLHLDIYYLSFLYAFLPFIAVMQLGWMSGCLVAINVWVLYLFKLSVIYPWWAENIIQVDAVLTFHIMLGFTLMMAKVILREQQSRKQTEKLLKALEQSNHQLRDYAEEIETLATIQERTRLARDIHDTLGHYLTAISIQLEKATVFFQSKPESALASIQQSKTLADEALREVRHSVGMLRSTARTFSLTQALERMVNRVQSNILKAHLEISGDPDLLSEPLLMSLYRAAQEGLTNIQKHAEATEVVVHVSIEAQLVTMLIQDNGCGFKAQEVNNQFHGYGLCGLRERLRLVGGSLSVDSEPGLLTQLKILIPMTGT